MSIKTIDDILNDMECRRERWFSHPLFRRSSGVERPSFHAPEMIIPLRADFLPPHKENKDPTVDERIYGVK